METARYFGLTSTAQAFSLLHSFTGGLNDGQNPYGSLTLSGSTFYGMALGGGSVVNDGVVVKIAADGSNFGLVHSFQGGTTDGSGPLGSLVQSGSTLYGMTTQGGTANIGTVFKVNSDGSGFGVIHSFTGAPADGRTPSYSTPVISGTTLYGMTAEGGIADQGSVYKVNTDGTGFSLLHSFDPAAGGAWDPAGSLNSCQV